MRDGELTRRGALRLMAGGTAGAVLGACVSGTAPSSPPAGSTDASKPAGTPAAAVSISTTTAARPEVAPKTGGTLKQGYFMDIVNLDPQYKVGNDATWIGVYDRITAYDSQLQPQPMLAESWDTDDFTSIKLNLRKGVQFHSGREMTSDDVKYTLVRTADPKVAAAQYTGMAQWFPTIETPDKYTVILRSDQPRPTVFDLLEFIQVGDKTTLEGPDAKTTAVGTGPFRLAEWVPGDHATLAKNSSYWQSGKPYLDSIQIPVFRDQVAMVTTLEAGQIDIARPPALVDLVRLQKDANYQVSINPQTGGYNVTGVNLTKPPFDNKLLRQALNYAIDRQRYADTIAGGLVHANPLPWPAYSPAYEPAKLNAYAFDLDKARSLLQQSGVSVPEFDYVVTPGSEADGFGQIYQADLARIGLKMNLKDMDSATWVDQVNHRLWFGVYWAPVTYAHLSPSTALINGKAFNPQLNNSGFTSDTYVQLMNDAAKETDVAKQRALYSQMNDLLLDESFVAFVAPTTSSSYIARSNVQGIAWTAHESPWYTEAWLK
ncbi:MAG: ABC transporter substrate-binding protein [Chloroflexi bacterium]|nr:ABC transporter substrate-binding protein [Chloroflexota bacterium]MBV9602773.1 ABC transporter substrate-binding protein [Chloroflexota bacterium]